MTLDRRFALIADDDLVLYPYKKRQNETGRYGFAASTEEHGKDRFGGGYYTEDLQEIIRGVIFDEWGVRAKSGPESPVDREGSYFLGKRAIHRYWIAPELAHLAKGATIPPEPLLPLASHQSDDGITAFNGLTVEDFIGALNALDGKITPNQHDMLSAHAAAPSNTLTMSALARHGGYSSHTTANLQYGALARRFVDHFRVPVLQFPMNAIAIDGPPGADKQLEWKLRAPLVEALARAGWLDSDVSRLPGGLEAQREVDEDPQAKALVATVRQALINARIGQGAYRKKMLRVWGGQCAVTGCAIERVLVASHAKPWAKSTNAERLDPYNGLLLSAALDRLFDGGLIAFADDGRLLVSTCVDSCELEKLGLRADARLSFVQDEHKPYLSAHRIANGFDQ